MNDHRPSAIVKTALVVLLCAIWGTTWLAIKLGLHDLPPLGSASARMLVAGVAMVLLAPRLARWEGGTKPVWWLWGVVGTLHLGASFSVVYWCGTRLPSGLQAVLFAVYPLLVAALGHGMLSNEGLVWRQIAGFVAAFCGVALLFWTDLRSIGHDAVVAGFVFLLSPLAAAIATMVAKRHGKGVSSVLINRNAMLLAAAWHALWSWLLGERWPAEITVRAVASVLYLAIPGTVVTFGVWFWLMRHVPAYRLSLVAYVTPAIALWVGAVVEREPVGMTTVLGTLVIFFGVVLASRAGTKR